MAKRKDVADICMGFILLGLVVAGTALLIRELLRSPEGYEDEAGFHFGAADDEPKVPAVKVEPLVQTEAERAEEVARLIPEQN